MVRKLNQKGLKKEAYNNLLHLRQKLTNFEAKNQNFVAPIPTIEGVGWGRQER